MLPTYPRCQALVSMLALTVPLEAEVQVGLNARDPTVFEEQLQAAHEVSDGVAPWHAAIGI